MITISPTEIGNRINLLRKRKGLSQEDLAKLMKISRPSIVQMELGNRSISVQELQRLSLILNFSLDQFVSKEFTMDEPMAASPLSKKNELRISVPSLSVDKFRNILLYILEACAGKPNVGETVLYKLLYFSDFNYYELYEEHLSGATYRKLPFGPVPQKLDRILEKMIEQNQIQRVKAEYFKLPQTRYLPLVKPDLTGMKASEKEVIDQVIRQYADWSASAISSYSHKDMPWLATKEGSVIDYELAFYRESPFSVRNYANENEES